MASVISNEESNYIKIALLILRISTKAVRNKFDYEFHPACLKKTLRDKTGLLLELKRQNRINQNQWAILFPGKGLCPY